VLLGAVVLWVMGDSLGISAVTTAMIALSTLLATGVLTWSDCLAHRTAWDVLLWFSILMGMCSALAQGGVIAAFAAQAKTALASMNLHWTGVFAILHCSYFSCHYVFASQVGHVGALYGAFLAMMMAAGVPTLLAALSLGYCSNLFGTISHYASGPATVYYSSGYIEIGEVMLIGGLLGLRSLLVWGVVGMAWWKFLGWW
jgi:DASS family divalent anion:Na+ symporter